MRATHCTVCSTPLPPPSSPHDGRRKYCSERCRKSRYGQPCVDCGARTSYGAESARVPDPRCHLCAVEYYRVWTRERLIERLQAWAYIYGEPPAGSDWNPWQCRHELRDEARAQRFEAGHWPTTNTIYREFGSWTAAMQAAGFQPRAPHGGGGNEQRSRTMRAKAAA